MRVRGWIGCFFILLMGLSGRAVVFSRADSVVLQKFWAYAQKHKLGQMPYGDRVVMVGRFFLGRPYKGGTLNVADSEKPVINLREFDCVTFVDNTLALTFLNRYDGSETDRFVSNLTRLRYRNGKIKNYVSRLHYSSDWLHEMERQQILEDVTEKAGGIPFPCEVWFMSRNYKKYPPLVAQPAMVEEMKKVEKAMNARKKFYVPKQSVRKAESGVLVGDVLLLTTSIKGLDTSHVGIAVKKGGRVYLMHASSTAKKVVVSDKPLTDYMAGVASQTGIMVGRVHLVPGEDWIVY